MTADWRHLLKNDWRRINALGVEGVSSLPSKAAPLSRARFSLTAGVQATGLAKALIEAVLSGRAQEVERVLSLGADPMEHNGLALLMAARGGSGDRSVEIIKALASVMDLRSTGSNALIQAARSGLAPEALEILAKGASGDALGDALVEAAGSRSGSLASVEALLNLGADARWGGSVAFLFALSSANVEAASRLLPLSEARAWGEGVEAIGEGSAWEGALIAASLRAECLEIALSAIDPPLNTLAVMSQIALRACSQPERSLALIQRSAARREALDLAHEIKSPASPAAPSHLRV